MPTDPTTKAIADVKKSIDSLRKSVDDLAKMQERLHARERGTASAPSIDSLNEEEIEELRALSSHRTDVARFTEQRLADPFIAGMYRGFHDLGLVSCYETNTEQMTCLWVSPKALWVVQRHDRAEKERTERAKRETIRFAISIAVPSIVSLAAVILTWWLTACH